MRRKRRQDDGDPRKKKASSQNGQISEQARTAISREVSPGFTAGIFSDHNLLLVVALLNG
jgi:hypothetical protein